MKVLLCFVWIVSVKMLRIVLDVCLFPVCILPMIVYHLYRYKLTGNPQRHCAWNAWRPTTFLGETLGTVLQRNWQEAEQMAGKWDSTEDRSERTLLRGSREKQGVL